MSKANVTRGYGVLERFLAHKRAAVADALIPDEARSGRVLDVGCGMSPLFLSTTQFPEKYGIDKLSQAQALSDNQGPADNISLKGQDIEADPVLPFDDGYFDVVTMLAVFEHIAPDRLPMVIRQVHRVLKDDGLCIITTPAPWSRGLLKLMARLWLVSPREIREHRAHYDARAVSTILMEGGFKSHNIRHGYFEFGLNLWLTARK